MRYALCDNNVIVNVIEYDGKNKYTPINNLKLCEVNNWVNIGDHKDTPKLQEKP